MSISTRFFAKWSALILTGWICVLLGSGSLLSYGENQNPGKNQHEAQNSPSKFTPSPTLRPNEHVPSNYKQSNSYQDMQKFLQSALSILAQPKITDWLVVAITAVYAFLVYLQWRAIRRQANLTERIAEANRIAADAARNSAGTAHEALIKGQRAFVQTVGFPWLWRPDFGRPGKYLYDITPTIENAGNTPTNGMRIVVDYSLRDAPLPDEFGFPYRAEPKPTLVGARQTIGASNAVILDDDLLAVQKGEKFFYIWGTINYRDVFDGTPVHTTEFCTQISRVMGNPLDPRDPNLPKGTSLEIYFGIHEKHNQTD